MSAALEPRVVRGVRCLPVPEREDRWWYLPTEPVPGRSPAGEPTVMLVELGAGAILQLETHLGPVQDIALVRRELAGELAQERGASGASIRLDPAPITVEAVELRLLEEHAPARVLARSRPAGHPPHTALFNVRLGAAERSAVASALAARSGVLEIAYRGIALPAAARRHTATTWSSSSTTVTTEIRSGGGPSTDSIHAERSSLVSDDSQPDGAHAPTIPDLVADVATWFAGDRRHDHFLLAPLPTPPASTPPNPEGDPEP